MKAFLLIQQLLVFGVVAYCALYSLRKLAPAAFRRGQVLLALQLLRDSRPALLRRLGRRLAPAPSAAFALRAAACGGCSGCGTKDAKSAGSDGCA